MSTLTVSNLQSSGGGGVAATLSSINGGQISGNRNRVINGGMAIDQRNAGSAQTFTAAAALAYSVDRWYGYCTGANVNGQQVAGASAGQFYYRFTGAASVTGIGFGQRIEQLNSADLAGTTATLSVDLANSFLTSVTWTAYYATTADTFGTLASPTRTQIATGNFSVTSTVTRYSTQISVPAAATTGIEIVFSVGAQTSGTWTIGNVQFEAGNVTTPYERRPYAFELGMCQRYTYRIGGAFNGSVSYQLIAAGGRINTATTAAFGFQHPVTMRASPSFATGTIGNMTVYDATGSTAASSAAVDISSPTNTSVIFTCTGATFTVGRSATVYQQAANATSVTFTSEL